MAIDIDYVYYTYTNKNPLAGTSGFETVHIVNGIVFLSLGDRAT